MKSIDFSQLRGLKVAAIERALYQDGFILKRQKGATRVYSHADGRRVVLHWHNPNQQLKIGTLQEVIEREAQWAEADLKRLKLLK